MIPSMTDPMGKFWDQPPRSSILLDDTHAVMDEVAFGKLATYSSTIPSGVYPGKMWKAKSGDVWFLRWFGEVPGRPDLCSRNERTILLVSTQQKPTGETNEH